LPGSMDWRPPDFVEFRPGTYCISATMLQCVYVQPPGPWNARSEERYRLVREAVDEFSARQQQEPNLRERLLNDPAAAEDLAHWKAVFAAYDGLRFARLCAYLRRRDPDDSVGYSILIYRVGDRDLDFALNRPYFEW